MSTSLGAPKEILGKLQKLAEEKFGIQPEDFKEKDYLADSMDSLDRVEFIMDVERTFMCSIPDDVAEKLSRVGDFVAYLNEGRVP